MENQIVAGRTVRLKSQKSISATPPGSTTPTSVVVPPGTRFTVVGVEGDQVRVEGIERDAPRGEYVWPISDVELVDEA